MPNTVFIKVEVAYATPEEQVILSTDIPEGATIEEAIEASGILTRFPEIDLNTAKVGVFSKKQSLSYVLRAQDRVEIYRPLIADPKEGRKQRAAEAKAKRAQ